MLLSSQRGNPARGKAGDFLIPGFTEGRQAIQAGLSGNYTEAVIHMITGTAEVAMTFMGGQIVEAILVKAFPLANQGFIMLQARATGEAAAAAGKGITSVDDLLSSAGKLEKLKGGVQQGLVKGDATTVFQDMTKGAEQLKSGAYKLSDGTILNSHISTTTGVSTIDINQAGKIFKIRIEP